MLIFRQHFTEMVTFSVPRSPRTFMQGAGCGFGQTISNLYHYKYLFRSLGCLAVFFFFHAQHFLEFIFIFRRMAASRLLRSASLLPAREESGKLSSSSRFDSTVLSEFKMKSFDSKKNRTVPHVYKKGFNSVCFWLFFD
jgi:hypothetical protein